MAERTEPRPGEVYVHTKSGNRYRVIAVGREESNPKQRRVVYRRDDEQGEVWLRGLASWNAIEPDGRKKFERVCP